jgi:hypothetical protein
LGRFLAVKVVQNREEKARVDMILISSSRALSPISAWK